MGFTWCNKLGLGIRHIKNFEMPNICFISFRLQYNGLGPSVKTLIYDKKFFLFNYFASWFLSLCWINECNLLKGIGNYLFPFHIRNFGSRKLRILEKRKEYLLCSQNTAGLHRQRDKSRLDAIWGLWWWLCQPNPSGDSCICSYWFCRIIPQCVGLELLHEFHRNRWLSFGGYLQPVSYTHLRAHET